MFEYYTHAMKEGEEQRVAEDLMPKIYELCKKEKKSVRKYITDILRRDILINDKIVTLTAEDLDFLFSGKLIKLDCGHIAFQEVEDFMVCRDEQGKIKLFCQKCI